MRPLHSLLALFGLASALSLAACDQHAAASCDKPKPVASHAPAPRAHAPSAPVASASAAPAPQPAARQPMNVIMLVVDAWRDDMPWNGYPREVVPNLHKLWAKSVRYERGYAASSFTSKSVPVLLSGHYASSLARGTTFFSRYSKDNVMMAEVLQKAGIRTLGLQAHMYLKEAAGLQQGFDVWDMVPNIEWDYDKDPYITGPDHTKGAIDILSKPENTGKQFFAYFHYMDPHDVYNVHPEAPDFGKTGRDRYDNELWFTDMWIQKLLDYVEAQPWAKNTAIIVTGDHGEAFGEHKFYRHAFELYEVLVRVPLFVYIPGATPHTIPRWRSAIDLAPTVYDLMGQPIPDDLPGTSLVPELFGAPAPKRPIICDLPADSLNVRHRTLIDEDGYKLVALGHDVRFEMYNVIDDPGEKHDLFKRDKERAEAMVARYKKLSAEIPFVAAKGGKPVKKD